MPILPAQGCCLEDHCTEPQTVAVPGPPGADGAPGTNGTDGENAFTTASAFVMPAEQANVSVTVGSSDWMVVGQNVVAAAGGAFGEFQVIAKPTGVSATLKNLENTATGEYAANSAPGTNFPNGTAIGPGGRQGPSGSNPAGALLSANNLIDVASAASSRTNLGLTSAATTPIGVSDNQILTVDDAAGLTAGEALFATASGAESLAASAARTALGLGTMATQAASAVAITGGALNGTLGATTAATAQVTTFTASGVATFAGNVIVSSRLFAPTAGATQSLLAATAINPVGLKIKVVGNGGAVVLTATPTITAPATDGQLLLIQGTDGTNTVTLQDEASLAGTGLELGAATRVLGLGDTILLTWDSAVSKWFEIAFSNN